MRTTNCSYSVYIATLFFKCFLDVILEFYVPLLTQLLWVCIEIKFLRKYTSNTNVLYFKISPLVPSWYYYLTVKPFHKSSNTLKGFKLQNNYMLYCLSKGLLMQVNTTHCNCLIVHLNK